MVPVFLAFATSSWLHTAAVHSLSVLVDRAFPPIVLLLCLVTDLFAHCLPFGCWLYCLRCWLGCFRHPLWWLLLRDIHATPQFRDLSAVSPHMPQQSVLLVWDMSVGPLAMILIPYTPSCTALFVLLLSMPYLLVALEYMLAYKSSHI